MTTRRHGVIIARIPDTQSGAGDLSAARVIAALITKAQNDAEFAEQNHARFVEPRRDQAGAIFARAIDRDEIPPDTDI